MVNEIMWWKKNLKWSGILEMSTGCRFIGCSRRLQANHYIRILIWPRKYKTPLWYKKGCQRKDLKTPLELERKDNYVKFQNNFNYYCHFQDHSNAHDVFHLGTRGLYFYSHNTWLQKKLFYPFIILIYHTSWKKGWAITDKAFFFFFLKRDHT